MDFSKYLQIYTERTNYVLRKFIRSQYIQNTLLVKIMEYGVLLGGKRLRPILVYATGNMFGIGDDTLDVAAAAVEFIHAYSLMHDDLPIMDNDDLRRGLPTCHIKFGEAKAILAGNALQALAFSVLSNAPMIGVNDHYRLLMLSRLAVASGAAGICSGQIMDIESERKQITLEQLKLIYRYKTGSLIRAAVNLGALSAGDRGLQAMPILDYYAECIGLAFQIQDDILDIIGNTVTLGKRHGVDQQLGKNTYPSLLGIEQSKYKAKNLIDNALQSLNQLNKQSLDTSILEYLANYIIQRDQ